MFYRMLKKDLKETPGLNIFILISMIASSILIVAGSIQLYASISGFSNSYKQSNSTDVFLLTAKSVSNGDEKHAAVENWLNNRSDIINFNCTDMIPIASGNIQVNEEEYADKIGINAVPCYIVKQPDKTNLVYDLQDSRITIADGTIAINHFVHAYYQVNIGDKIRLTTQFGNTYEFTVAHIVKDSSVYMFYRFILSDSDYKHIASESPFIINSYEIASAKFSDVSIAQSVFSDYEKEKNLEKMLTHYNCVSFEGSKLMTSIVAILCAGIAVFLILIVAMTLRFTLTSIIKKEERRIGTLRAIGVDSLSFKWLFAAKFIFFSIISGITGVFLGIPIANILLDSVMLNTLKPSAASQTCIGVISGCLTVLLIIQFIFKSLRRIDKISIITAIHGENRSDRFKKIPGLELKKHKKMMIPLFLALTDILGRFKRYIFLSFSYVFGFAIILLVFQLKSTVISWDFLHKTQLMGKYDFFIDLSKEEYENYALKTDGTLRGVNNKINEELSVNNIPAFIDTMTFSEGSIIKEGNEYLCGFVSGINDVSKLYYRKDGVAPKLKNETAMNYLFAKKFGISIGDTISLKFKKKSESKLNYSEVIEEFIVTGFVDICSNAVIAVMASNMNDIFPIQVESSQISSNRTVSCEISASKDDKPYYLQKIRDLYGSENVKTEDEYFGELWGSSVEWIFIFLRSFISILVLLVMILNAALYEQIFIEEEASDIAMLKTIGFPERDIKLWHYLRILILVISGFILGAIVTATTGNALMETAVNVLMYASGFDLIVTPFIEYVSIPLALVSIISVVLFISFKNINSIFVWRIKDE